MTEQNKLTPVFRQYTKHKNEHKDAFLFFRLGDFYEMFYSDALEASRLLNLTLTHRQDIPMCGVPAHAAGNYIARLLRMGKKVAVCEQTESSENTKGLLKREVVEIVTPGTVVDDVYLEDKSNNYLAALTGTINNAAFAYIDLSTGEFYVTKLDSEYAGEMLRRELTRITPRELIVQESLLSQAPFVFLHEENLLLERLPDWAFELEHSEDILKRQFGTLNLKAFGFENQDIRIPAAAAILDYLNNNRKGSLNHVRTLVCYGDSDYVGMDESTIRNLELVRNIQSGNRSFTLIETLDHTKTPLGSRALKRRILHPSPNLKVITAWHERVDKLYHDQITLSSVRKILSGILDLERLSARVAMDRAHAKDLLSVGASLRKAIEIREILKEDLLGEKPEILESLFLVLKDISDLIEQSLLEDPSIQLNEGRLIRDGYDEEIDKIRKIRQGGTNFLKEYIEEEKSSTKISSLKLRKNRVLGYFLEVRNTHADKVPTRFRLRQTLVNASRFSTPQLENLEVEINSAEARLIEREKIVFLQIRNTIKTQVSEILRVARILAEIDITQSLAHAATVYGYVRPVMEESPLIDIRAGRHPVVERHMPQGDFVPNSIRLSADDVSFILMTGPNMAGKSTVLRQTALIVLMAQIGSFVPAESALIGIADRIYCRVGASDNLARGESTFLVEMNETANILRNATRRSLIIMDEVGRGTSTADGLAIAQAVSEDILERLQSRTLFATHHRELTFMKHPSLINLSMAAKEYKNQIVFPKTIVEGPAKSSYGIHVAALAGIPGAVIQRAAGLVEEINAQKPLAESSEPPVPPPSLPMLFNREAQIADEIESIDPNKITPLEALNILTQLHEEVEKSRKQDDS